LLSSASRLPADRPILTVVPSDRLPIGHTKTIVT